MNLNNQPYAPKREREEKKHHYVNASLVIAATYIRFITVKWGQRKAIDKDSCFKLKSITFLVPVVELETYLNSQCTNQCFFRKTQ